MESTLLDISDIDNVDDLAEIAQEWHVSDTSAKVVAAHVRLARKRGLILIPGWDQAEDVFSSITREIEASIERTLTRSERSTARHVFEQEIDRGRPYPDSDINPATCPEGLRCWHHEGPCEGFQPGSSGCAYRRP